MKGTVLWLEESHGDWGTTVLLERDGAFSLTGPEEDLEATRLWMADTLLALRGAVRPHLDQVMRVAGGGPEPPSATSLIQYLIDCGLLFPRELVANYILALQTKRFAILTGISGTGKTRIAKAVAEHFRAHTAKSAVARIPDDAVEIQVMPYQFKYSRLMVPREVGTNLSLLGPEAPLADRQIGIRYPQGETTLAYYHDRQGATALLFRGEFKKWFRSNVKPGDRLWLRVQEGDPPGADGLDIGIGDTVLVEAPVHNYVVVPVRPDWVDNRGLLGYLNPLTGEYSTEPIPKSAAASPRRGRESRGRRRETPPLLRHPRRDEPGPRRTLLLGLPVGAGIGRGHSASRRRGYRERRVRIGPPGSAKAEGAGQRPLHRAP